MAFSDNFKLLREKRGLSQEQLAEHLKIPRSTITHYESQSNERLPRMDRLQLIADYFGVSIDRLVSNTFNDVSDDLWDVAKSKELDQQKSEVIPKGLPILGTIRAGLPILAEENIEGYLDVPEYMRADYVLQVKGNSMIGAGILDGDLAICREAAVPQTGQIIIALHDEGSLSEATLKFYMNGNGNPVLRSANPTFADIDYKDGYRTAGVLVALVRKDAPGYQVYKNYIAIPGYDDWTGVIEKATGAGIKPEHLNSHVDMLIEMGKKR